MEVAEARPGSDAPLVYNSADNSDSIKSKQSEDASNKMGWEGEAVEMAAPLRCQESDAMLEGSAAECAIEVSNPVVGADETSCMRCEVPAGNGSYLFGELQGLEVTYTEDNDVSDTIVNPKVYKRICTDVQPRLFQTGWMI